MHTVNNLFKNHFLHHFEFLNIILGNCCIKIMSIQNSKPYKDMYHC